MSVFRVRTLYSYFVTKVLVSLDQLDPSAKRDEQVHTTVDLQIHAHTQGFHDYVWGVVVTSGDFL